MLDADVYKWRKERAEKFMSLGRTLYQEDRFKCDENGKVTSVFDDWDA